MYCFIDSDNLIISGEDHGEHNSIVCFDPITELYTPLGVQHNLGIKRIVSTNKGLILLVGDTFYEVDLEGQILKTLPG